MQGQCIPWDPSVEKVVKKILSQRSSDEGFSNYAGFFTCRVVPLCSLQNHPCINHDGYALSIINGTCILQSGLLGLIVIQGSDLLGVINEQ